MQAPLSQLCRTLMTRDCWSWLGSGKKAMDWSNSHRHMEDLAIAELSQSWLHYFFFLKIAYYWGEKHVLVMTAARAKWNSRHSRGQIFLGWWRSPHPVSLSLASSGLPSPFLYFWTCGFSKAFAYSEWLFGQQHQKFQPGREEGRRAFLRAVHVSVSFRGRGCPCEHFW